MATDEDSFGQASFIYEGATLARICPQQSIPVAAAPRGAAPPAVADPAAVEPDVDDTWKPPDWVALAHAKAHEPVTVEDRQRLTAELDYRLHLMHECATAVGEAAILAAERVQDQQIASIAALRDNLGEEWGEELLVALLATLLLPVPGGFLGAFMFRPMLRAVAGSGARSVAGPVSRGVARRLGKTRGMSKGAIRRAYPRQTNDGAVLEALKVVDDPQGIDALAGGDRRKTAVQIVDALNAAGEDMGARVLPALGAVGKKMIGGTPQEVLTIEGARTQFLATIFSLGTQIRMWDARTQYRLRLQVLAETMTYDEAAQMLADLTPPDDPHRQSDLGLTRLRAALALEFEATIWSLSLARLLCDPPPQPMPTERGVWWLALSPSLTWSSGHDRELADYLVGRFFDVAYHWKKELEKPRPCPVPTNPDGKDALVLEYLRNLARQGPLKVRDVREILNSVSSRSPGTGSP